jgi:hypothetical protein
MNLGCRIRAAGFEVLNRVVINQVLVCDHTDDAARAAPDAAIANGEIASARLFGKAAPHFALA